MALYMIGFITYGATLVFYAALFPRLARNTAHARQLRDQYERGEISVEEYEREESLEKNRISNISTVSTPAGARRRGAEVSCVGTQQYWVHRHARSEPHHPATSGERPEGQQLRPSPVNLQYSFNPRTSRSQSTTERTDIGCCWASGGVCIDSVAGAYSSILITLHAVIFQQPRPGPPLPKGEHYMTIGWKQVWRTALKWNCTLTCISDLEGTQAV